VNAADLSFEVIAEGDGETAKNGRFYNKNLLT